MKSRNEIDFLRLLRQCQNLANQKGWRLEKYVDALSEKLDDIRSQSARYVSRDNLEEYERKVQFLKGLIETEKLPSAEKRLLAAELLAPDLETKSTQLLAKNKYYKQIRDELLSSNQHRTKDNRIGAKSLKESDDEDDKVNEDLSQDLLELTNNLKETMRTANMIIQKDTESLTKIQDGADSVGMRMQTNTERLNEFVRKGYQAFVWLILFLVTIMFLMMVIFIRANPKPPRY